MSNQSFKNPLQIRGSLSQIREFIPKLEALGYKKSSMYNERADDKVIHTQYYPGTPEEGLQITASTNREDGRILNVEQEEHILALAAMRTDGNIQPGEYVIMVRAGGWSYSPTNNGSIARITSGRMRDDMRRPAWSLDGVTLNPKEVDRYCTFTGIPVIGNDGEVVIRRATEEEIDKYFGQSKTQIMTVGSRVKIKETSQYYSKSDRRNPLERGTIVNDNGGSGHRFRVDWDNGENNVYTEDDLLLIDEQVLGYTCPKDLFNGEIKAGTLYKLEQENPSLYFPEGSSEHYVPKEIAESWVPVYDLQLEVGDLITPVSEKVSYLEPGKFAVVKEINDKIIYFQHETDGSDYIPITDRNTLRKATPEEKRAFNTIKVGTYEAEFYEDFVKFGCQRFTLAQVEALDELFKREGDVKVELSLNENKITRNMIQKVLLKLKPKS